MMDFKSYRQPTIEDRHIFLYAKGWYQKNNLIYDLQKIFGERLGIEHYFITINTIVEVF